MDIRKFFGKADSKKSGAKKKPGAGANAATARPKVAPADAPKQEEKVVQESKKRPSSEIPKEKQDHVEVSKEDFFAQADSNGKKPAAKKPKHDNVVVEVSEEGSPSPAKKQKQEIALEEEIAVGDIESKPLEHENVGGASPSAPDDAGPTAKKESSAELTIKKRKLVIDDDDDDDDDVVVMNPVSKSSKKKIKD